MLFICVECRISFEDEEDDTASCPQCGEECSPVQVYSADE